jgi:hypothetical protein
VEGSCEHSNEPSGCITNSVTVVPEHLDIMPS